MKQFCTSPLLENVDEVTAFVEGVLSQAGVEEKVSMQLAVVTDEIFSNIALYSKAKSVTVYCEVQNGNVELVFCDDGTPYDPTLSADPDITLSAEERDIGGLGVFLVKKMMDELKYEYRSGINVLSVKKMLNS